MSRFMVQFSPVLMLPAMPQISVSDGRKVSRFAG
jgi:hypothetical protein